jgi:hypothetical protein
MLVIFLLVSVRLYSKEKKSIKKPLFVWNVNIEKNILKPNTVCECSRP